MYLYGKIWTVKNLMNNGHIHIIVKIKSPYNPLTDLTMSQCFYTNNKHIPHLSSSRNELKKTNSVLLCTSY